TTPVESIRPVPDGESRNRSRGRPAREPQDRNTAFRWRLTALTPAPTVPAGELISGSRALEPPTIHGAPRSGQQRNESRRLGGAGTSRVPDRAEGADDEVPSITTALTVALALLAPEADDEETLLAERCARPFLPSWELPGGEQHRTPPPGRAEPLRGGNRDRTGRGRSRAPGPAADPTGPRAGGARTSPAGSSRDQTARLQRE